MLKKLLSSVLVMMAIAGTHAAAGAPLFSVKKQVLPDLATPSDLPVRRFAIDGQAATVGGDTRDQTWTTQLSYSSRLDAAMNVDYGLRFDRTLAGGANLVYGTRHKELLLNAVYAPRKDLRLKLSGGQMRQTEDFQFASGLHAEDVVQHNYLLDVRKYWEHDAFFSDVSLTAWSAYADDTALGQKLVRQESDLATRVYTDPRALAPGALNGYMLNLAVAPLPQSRLELGTGMDRLTYDFADGSSTRDSAASRHLSYTQYLPNCSRLQGSYQSNAASRSFGVSVARGAWRIGASRTLERDGGDGDYTVNAGYTISLGQGSGGACGSDLKSARSFGSMVSGSVARNPNLPTAPLVQVDPTVKPVLSAVWAKGQAR